MEKKSFDLLSYIGHTPENTNQNILYNVGMPEHGIKYIIKAPDRMNVAIADLFMGWENPVSVKPRDVADINEALANGEKSFINKKIIMDGTISLYGENEKARTAAPDFYLRNGGELKATKDCGWFMLIAREGATLVLNGNGRMSSNGTKAIPVTAASGSTIWIEDGNYRCSYEAGECVYADNATVYIYGGTFGMDEGEQIHPLLNVKNGQNVSQIRVCGGRFIGWNPETGDDVMGGSFVDDGYESIEIEPNVWEVRSKEEK